MLTFELIKGKYNISIRFYGIIEVEIFLSLVVSHLGSQINSNQILTFLNICE